MALEAASLVLRFFFMKLEVVQISTGERKENQTNSIFSCPESTFERTFCSSFSKKIWKNQRRRRWFFLQQGGHRRVPRLRARNAPRPASISFLKHKIAPFTVQLHFISLLSYHLFLSNRHCLSSQNQQDNRMYKIQYNTLPTKYKTCYLLFLYTSILCAYLTHYTFNITYKIQYHSWIKYYLLSTYKPPAPKAKKNSRSSKKGMEKKPEQVFHDRVITIYSKISVSRPQVSFSRPPFTTHFMS